MSDVKREILFNKSMTIDKRNPDFAYLRKNAFNSYSKGLYPSRDFYQELPDETELPTSSYAVRDVLGSDQVLVADIKVIVEYDGDVLIYELGSNSLKDTIVGVDYECGAYGDDGVHIVCSDDGVYGLGETSSTTGAADGIFTDARPDIGGFDGLYYWWLSNNEIYKQLDNDAPTIAFNNIGIQPRFVDFHNDQMIIFCQVNLDIVILFWDKSDTDLFDKRVVVKNSKLIAGGVVDGRIMLVKSIGNSGNPLERNGEMVICGFDGEKFARLNSIKTGRKEVEYVSDRSVGLGSEVMLFGVDGNRDDFNDTLYQDYLYKVYSDGSIEVQDLPSSSFDEVTIVRVFYNFICYVQNPGSYYRIYINEEGTAGSYGDNEDYNTTEYITNFLNNPYNLHKLDGLAVAFEKIFEQTDTESDPVTGEELDIYYRVSERDEFTLLGNITAEKIKDDVNQREDETTAYEDDDQGMTEQRYMIAKMPDGNALPEFNEIQFKFVPKRGFAIIGAWYQYSYLSRNTFN